MLLLKKKRRDCLFQALYVTSLLCFVGIALQCFLAMRYTNTHVKSDMSFVMKVFGIASSTEMKSTTTVNPMLIEKLSNINKELNYNGSHDILAYPGKMVGRYLFMNPNLCRTTDRVDIIIIVHTAPSHLEKRQRIRNSFANELLFHPFQIRVAFLLGKVDNATLEKRLWVEYARHNDTVMGDFLDDYHNLTLKGVMGYHWVSEYCSNSRFVLKVDDDVAVNMFKLLYHFLNHMNGKRKSIFCNLWHKGTMGILRSGKWRVNRGIFPSQTTYPYYYCSGFVVLMTSDLMRPLYEAAKITPFFWIDDVYLFGMLPSIVGGVTFHNYALEQNVTLNWHLAIKCAQTQGPSCPIFATTITDIDYWLYWNVISSFYSLNSWQPEKIVVN